MTTTPTPDPLAEVERVCTCVENVQRYAAYKDNIMRDCEAHPYWPESRCRATFDKPQRQDRSDTHTCGLGAGHPGAHYCVHCKSEWTAPNPAIGTRRDGLSESEAITEADSEHWCICDYAHDTKSPEDNEALQAGCNRFWNEVVLPHLAARAEQTQAGLAGRVAALADECADSGCIHLNEMYGKLRALLADDAAEGGAK